MTLRKKKIGGPGRRLAPHPAVSFPTLIALLPLVCVLMAHPIQASPVVTQPQGRAAFYRGEVVTLRVDWPDSPTKASDATRVVLELDGMELATATADPSASSAILRLDTRVIRSGDYTFNVTVKGGGGSSATSDLALTIAPRPNPQAMAVWMWPHQAFLNSVERFDDEGRRRVDWWHSLGLTNFSFVLGAEHPETVRRWWDYALANGMTVCLQPEGGLAEVKLESDDPDVWFREPGGAYRHVSYDHSQRVANPFHPKVARWQNERNRAHMSVAQHYPQVTTAFFNTEMIDDLRRNANVAGNHMLKETLGFDESTLLPPRFVQPGVIAENDPNLRYHKYVYRRGNGLAEANRRAGEVVHAYRPDVLTINDPFRSYAMLGGFAGVDAVSTWTYLNPDPKLMLAVESLRAASRDGDKTALSTVTLLNYPGELAPTDRWMMMGSGRLTVATWINLSRAPRMLSYYFSSNCDPFAALADDLKTPTKVNDFEVPQATFDTLRTLSERVIKPYGPMIKSLDVSPRRIAVLDSTTSRLWGSSPALRGFYNNLQPYHFYTVLAMAHLPADVLFEDSIERYGLGDYDVLVLPKTDLLPENIYRTILDFQARGGLVIADQYLGPEIPGVVQFDFDFTYRERVSASAIAKNETYADWNDKIKVRQAATKSVQGVTALKDQETLEAYTRAFREVIDPQITRTMDCDSPTVLMNMLEHDGVRYLVLINDKRAYGERLGQYQSVLEDIQPQTARVTLYDAEKDVVPYDTLRQRRLDATRRGDRLEFEVELDALGGTIVALLPREIERIAIAGLHEVKRGDQLRMHIRVEDLAGRMVPGAHPLELEVTGPDGQPSEYSGYHCATDGSLTLDFQAALNDPAGLWRVRVRGLTAGRSAEASFEVVADRAVAGPLATH